MSTIESVYQEEIARSAQEAAAVYREMDEVSLCSIRMGDEVFGIDTEKVREVLGRSDRGSRRTRPVSAPERHDLRRVPLAPAFVAGVIPYRGEVLTTLSLRALLGGGEERAGGCVLVLDDEDTGERLGLMVDAVSGVVTVRKAWLEGNPCTLNARSKALFDGVYKMPAGLMVRIDPKRLSPARLAAAGLFDTNEDAGGAACAR